MTNAYALATEYGLLRFQMILRAMCLWSDLTPVQKRVLKEGGGPVAAITGRKLVELQLATVENGIAVLTPWAGFVLDSTQASSDSGSDRG